MKIQTLLLLAPVLISLTGCSVFSSNVIPASGPDMERVYDGMGHPAQGKAALTAPLDQKGVANTMAATVPANSDNENDNDDETSLNTVRQQVTTLINASGTRAPLSAGSFNGAFRKLPNPELQLYVFPHFAGSDEIPVPGYTTVFNAYERDHYALAQERG